MRYQEGVKCNKCQRIEYGYPQRICPKCGNILGEFSTEDNKKIFIVKNGNSIVIAKKILFWDKIVSERK